MAIGGFPRRRIPAASKAPAVTLPTVSAESIEHDEEDRRFIASPLTPAPVRPAPTEASWAPPAARPPGPPPRPANLPMRLPPQPTMKRFAPQPAPNKPFTPPRPMAFCNGVPQDLTVDDIPY